MRHPINLNHTDYRIGNRTWIELTDAEQRAVLCAEQLAHDSSYIPIVAGEIARLMDIKRPPMPTEPEWSI